MGGYYINEDGSRMWTCEICGKEKYAKGTIAGLSGDMGEAHYICTQCGRWHCSWIDCKSQWLFPEGDVCKICEASLKVKYTCAICKNLDIRGAHHKCPDCDRYICDKCWDTELLICTVCRKKMEMLKAPSPQASQPTAQAEGLSDQDRLFRFGNLFKMSKEVPLAVAAKTLAFAAPDDLVAWVAAQGLPGLAVDYTNNLIKLVNQIELETYIESLLA